MPSSPNKKRKIKMLSPAHTKKCSIPYCSTICDIRAGRYNTDDVTGQLLCKKCYDETWPPGCEGEVTDSASESEDEEEDEEEVVIKHWEDIKQFIVDEYDRGWLLEYPGGDRLLVYKENVVGKPRFAQPSVIGEADAKKEVMKHPCPAITCPTASLKEQAEEKGYKIYFSADKKNKQNYANQQRALGHIQKGKKNWDDYDHDWHSTKQTKARRTIDEVDKLRGEVAELKALVKTLMAKLG